MPEYFSPPSTTFTFIFPLMEICDYIMDPDGDVVIVLENPNAPFAVWDPAPAQDQDCTTSTPVKFRASSKHLQLASPVFKATLKGPWIEGSVTKRGYRQINTGDWDVEAFRIVLNVIHGCNRDVPRAMTLEMLCKVAVLVDYYQCHEAFDFSSLVWFNHLRDSFSETYGRNLVLWLCASYVFGDDKIFSAATKTAIKESSEMIRTLALPISERVINRINTRRNEAVNAISVSLHALKRGLISGSISGCSLGCRYRFLGWLITEMDKLQLLDVTAPPFYGVSIVAIADSVQNHVVARQHVCCFAKLWSNAQSSIDSAMKYVHPLELKDYMRVTKKA